MYECEYARPRSLLIQRVEKCLQTIDDEQFLVCAALFSSSSLLAKSSVRRWLAHHSISKKRDGKKVPHTKLNIARHSNQFVRISRNEETKYCCICSFLPRAKIYLFTSSHISSERFYSDCLLTSTANWRKEKCMEKKRTAKTECRFDSFFFYSTFQMIVKRASAIKRLKCMKK